MSIPLSKFLEDIINRNFNNISNLNLLLTKYVRGWSDDWQFEREVIERDNRGRERPKKINIKFEHPEEVIANVRYDKTTYDSFLNRWQLLLSSINATQIKGQVLWRLVVGLGSGSVLETSMTLHHTLGVPYIPATALKGVVSSYYIEKYKTKLSDEIGAKSEEEKKKYRKKDETEDYDLELFAMNKDNTYIKLFGNESQKGKVTFLDAYPTAFPTLEMDIMNPHYQDYYSENKDSKGKPIPPADWIKPNPIKFLTVAMDTEFIFCFKTDENALIDELKDLIKEALQNSGIGAKTSVGYGYFKNLEDVIETSSVPSISTDMKEENTEPKKQELPAYLKNANELKDEFLRPDGTLKSEEEYKNYLASQNREYSRKRMQIYAKAKKWYEKK